MKIRKLIRKLKIKWKNSLVRRILRLKKEIVILKNQLEEVKKQNHALVDQKTLDNIRIRELTLEVRK